MGSPVIAAPFRLADDSVRLVAANANIRIGRAQHAAAGAGAVPPPADAGVYRWPGLNEARGLPWRAWSTALLLHGLVALAVIALAWTSRPPVPLPPTTIAVVFEHPAPPSPPPSVPAQAPAAPPAAAVAPAPPPPTTAALPPPPAPAPEAAPAPAAAAPAVVLPLPPPARPRPPEVSRPAHPLPPASPPRATAALSPSSSAVPAAPRNPASAPAAAVPAAPVIPPRPASGVAGNRKPLYPALALSRRWQGRVMLQVQVSAAGEPLSVRVAASSGHSLLDDSALAAVRSWRFVPAMRAGQAVAGSVDVPVDFRIAD